MLTVTNMRVSGLFVEISTQAPPTVQQPPCAWQPCAYAFAGKNGITTNTEIAMTVKIEGTMASACL